MAPAPLEVGMSITCLGQVKNETPGSHFSLFTPSLSLPTSVAPNASCSCTCSCVQGEGHASSWPSLCTPLGFAFFSSTLGILPFAFHLYILSFGVSKLGWWLFVSGFHSLCSFGMILRRGWKVFLHHVDNGNLLFKERSILTTLLDFLKGEYEKVIMLTLECLREEALTSSVW